MYEDHNNLNPNEEDNSLFKEPCFEDAKDMESSKISEEVKSQEEMKTQEDIRIQNEAGVGIEEKTQETVKEDFTEQLYQKYVINDEKKDDSQGSSKKKNKKAKKVKKQGGLGSFFRRAVACLVFGLAFGGCAGAGFLAVNHYFGPASTESVQTDTQDNNVKSTPVFNVSTGTNTDKDMVVSSANNVTVVTTDITDMVEGVMPAMVSIVNTYTSTTSYWGNSYTQESRASGSGIIVAQSDSELIIVTNYHVIENQKKMEVTFIDGSTAQAQVKGTDADMDLAVIAIPLSSLKSETINAIAVARMGDSDSLKLGEPVIAIGNALGYGQSVTGGYVSALNRELTLSNGQTGEFIQTDAAINPGNSGGALLNINGEVIGINSNKVGGESIDGMGFAIPISEAKPIIESLMTKETKHKNESGKIGYLGIEPVTITDEVAYMYGYPKGVYVRRIENNSPSERAGMYSGDIIVSVGDTDISTYEELLEELGYHEPGSDVKVVVKRQVNGEYEKVELTVTLGERPQE